MTERPAENGTLNDGWRLAARLARRELRGGLSGFRIFIACLALGVAAIAAIGSLSEGVQSALRTDARKLLGGDVEIRVVHRPASAEQIAWLRRNAEISEVVEARAMAYRAGLKDPGVGDRLLVELKSVDAAYPLYGQITIRKDKEPRTGGPQAVRDLLARKDGRFGALVDPMVLARLNLKVGDLLSVGDADVEIRAALTGEPDRSTSLITLGPRVLLTRQALDATGLLRPGALFYYRYRVKLPPQVAPETFIARLRAAFPDAGWRVRSLAQSARGLRRFLDQLSLYLSLVGLTALLVGGLGVANGARAYLEGRIETIATLKCLGAPAALIFRTYLVQMMAIAALGVVIGLLFGAALPALLAGSLSGLLPIAIPVGIFPLPLILAAAFGMLTALAFSLWALARAREVPAGTLFRHAVAALGVRPRPAYTAATLGLVLLLTGLVLATAADRMTAVIFLGACAAAFLIFRLVAGVIASLAKAAAGRPAIAARRPGLRLALANLHRPGAPTRSVVLSLGLGATVLVAIAMIQANLTKQVRDQIPEAAPSFFFIDIQPQQVPVFDATIRGVAGAGALQRSAMIRARIVKVNGVPARQVKVAEGARWAVRSERGLTYAATPPDNAEIVAGKWWPKDYSGPPIISFDQRLAAGMGLKVGDTLTFNVLGREITARIANLRRIRWRTLGMNFTTIFAPGTLENAPHSHIATVHVPPEKELPLLAAVTKALPNVSAIRVRDALDTAERVLGNIGFAMRLTAGVTIMAGLLVLAGAVAAGHRRRVYDAVVLKVLGASRRRLLRTFLTEYGLLGLATSIVAAILGSITAWAVLTFAMRAEWTLLPVTMVQTAGLCLIVALLFGFIGTWRALGQKPAPLLRNE